VLGWTPAQGRRACTGARVNTNAPASGHDGGQDGGGTRRPEGLGRVGRRRARVGEGGNTCKKIIPAWLDGQHHRRRGASVASPLGSKAGASTKGREQLVLTLVATGRSAGVGEEGRRGSSARRKKTTARRHGGSGSRRARRRRGRLFPRAASVFALNDVPRGGLQLLLLPPLLLLLRCAGVWTGDWIPRGG
jgi:hypothetical protein